MQVTLLRRALELLHNPNALVAVPKGMRAVKLCSHKIFLFLTGVPANVGWDIPYKNSAVAAGRPLLVIYK